MYAALFTLPGNQYRPVRSPGVVAGTKSVIKAVRALAPSPDVRQDTFDSPHPGFGLV